MDIHIQCPLSITAKNCGCQPLIRYYPWYSNDFHGGQCLRNRLLPAQLPVLGDRGREYPHGIGQPHRRIVVRAEDHILLQQPAGGDCCRIKIERLLL